MIQFQKGLSMASFISKYGQESQCKEELFNQRWPKGFICPNCGNNKYCEIKSRNEFQCNLCHRQTSVKSRTIFHSIKVPLTKWFLAMYLITQCKNGISALELYRYLDISYNATWRIKQKIMEVMLEHENTKKLSGDIKIDDSYLGGVFVGGKRGRGSENKTPFVVALKEEKGKPLLIKFSMINGFRKVELKHWSEVHMTRGSQVTTDGLRCFSGVEDAGFKHEIKIIGNGSESQEESLFLWVNTVLGNLKNSLRGTYHAISSKHVPRYLAEFQYRFNRRFNLKDMVSRLSFIALRTPPLQARYLTMAEKGW